MRAAAILGLGCSAKNVVPFQTDSAAREVDWLIGIPGAADHVDVILLFGGDGTIHRHLGQLVKLGLPVLVVPAGSGNDFAGALGLGRVRDSLGAWRRFCSGHDNLRTIDLGVILPLGADGGGAPSTNSQGRSAPHYFCSVAGLGLDGEVARRANLLPRWVRGHGGYALSLVPTIFRFAAFPMKILTVDEDAGWTTRSDQPTTLAAFANTSTYGGGMKIAPRARMDDGQLDVCVIGEADAFRLACLFPTVYFGRHLGVREVEYFQAARLRVETGAPFDVYADGEYVCRTPVEVRVEPAALRVIVGSRSSSVAV
jgi:diacylglycerol kinase (ATP)